jgi:hypothetical protein
MVGHPSSQPNILALAPVSLRDDLETLSLLTIHSIRPAPYPFLARDVCPVLQLHLSYRRGLD